MRGKGWERTRHGIMAIRDLDTNGPVVLEAQNVCFAHWKLEDVDWYQNTAMLRR